MLIHQCIECAAISINRIAADDDTEMVIAVFQESFALDSQLHTLCNLYGIVPLNAGNVELLYEQLYGQSTDYASSKWRPEY